MPSSNPSGPVAEHHKDGSARPTAATPLNEAALQLPAPAVRGLAAAGLTTLGEAWAATDEILLALHGVGPKAVRMIRALEA
jgi:hypothetical protein